MYIEIIALAVQTAAKIAQALNTVKVFEFRKVIRNHATTFLYFFPMKYFLFAFILLTTSSLQAQEMDNQQLGQILERVADTLSGQDGRWQFMVQGTVLMCLTDENHNRMRIISPIVEVDKLDEDTLKNALVANFHTALDVKYAISEEIVWSVFIHPLKELTERQVEDAISQVFYAKKTFGFTFSSTELVFPGSTKKKENSEPTIKKDKT